jgi:DNA-binding response OmpR family regulator
MNNVAEAPPAGAKQLLDKVLESLGPLRPYDGAGRDEIVIADLSDDQEGGLEQINHTRSARPESIIVALGGRDSSAAIASLEEGADVYLPADARPSQIVAQLRAILRRLSPLRNDRIEIDSLQVDARRREAFVGTRKVDLTSREFELLLLLVENRGRPLSASSLAAETGRDGRAAVTSVKFLIRRLRSKLEFAGMTSPVILTRRGFGYTLDLPLKGKLADNR